MRHHLTSLHESIWDIVQFGARSPQVGDKDYDSDEVCWGEGEDATVRSMPSLQSLDQRRQDNGQAHPSSHTSSDEDL
jgi:hypothetical protein